MTKKEHSAKPEPDHAPSWSEKFLAGVELSSVVLITVSMWVAAVFVGGWIVFGCGDAQRGRLGKAINGINLNWKIGLLLLIPLFYRTIRTILERMQKGPLGMEFPILKKTEQDVVEETRPPIAGPK